MNLLDREPVAVLGLLGAFIALIVGFGVPVTNVQQGLITAFAAAVLTFLARAKAVPAVEVAAQDVPGVGIVAGPALMSVRDGEPVVVLSEPH